MQQQSLQILSWNSLAIICTLFKTDEHAVSNTTPKKISGHPGDWKVEVRCIDFGFKTTVLVSDLRKIKDEFFSLPALVTVLTWSSTSSVLRTETVLVCVRVRASRRRSSVACRTCFLWPERHGAMLV